MAGLNEPKLRQRFAQLRRELQKKLEQRVQALDPAGQKQRVTDCQGRLFPFLETYLPHFLPDRQYSLFHQAFAQKAERILGPQGHRDLGQKLVFAAPRGNGKTSLVKALVLQAVVYRAKNFVVLVSDTLEQSAEILEAVKLELEANPRLRCDFPQATGEGRSWTLGQVITQNGVKIKAFGTAKKIRGASHGVFRPDLILVDDLENDEAVRSLEHRNKIDAWFWKSLVPLGPPDQSHDILVVGTLLHYDSILARLLKHPGFGAGRFRAIEAWPHRMDLWERFETLYWSQGKEAALEFYRCQATDMKEGARLLWPQVQNLLGLMLKWTENRAAFFSEQQNEPIDESERIFKTFHYYKELPSDLVFFGAIDPSMGKENRGSDPSALVVLGRSGQGKFYVAEAVIKRLSPEASIQEVIRLQQTYRCHRWVVEVVQFQEFFKNELVRRSAELGVPIPTEGVRPNRDKGLRIESIQPHVHNGLILFHPTQGQLLDQLTYFPKADHDDGPDALQMAFALASGSTNPRVYSAGMPGGSFSKGLGGY